MDMAALALGNGNETAVEKPRLEKRKEREGSRNLREQAGQPAQAPSPRKNL
jgi:hypothetical protein